MAQPFAPPRIQAPLPNERPSLNQAANESVPFGQMGPLNFNNSGSSPTNGVLQGHQRQTHNSNSFTNYHHPSDASNRTLSSFSSSPNTTTGLFDTSAFDPSNVNQQPLPADFRSLPLWNPAFDFTTAAPSSTVPALERFDASMAPPFASLALQTSDTTNISSNGLDVSGNDPASSATPFASALASPSNVPWTDYLYPPSADIGGGEDFGLTAEQHVELMDSLSGPGMGMMQGILDATNRVFYPPNRQPL